MNLIWHIVKKDCRHVRWLIAASLAAFAGQIALGVWAERGSEAAFQAVSEMATANGILFSLQLLVAMLLTVEIVQVDLLVDPKAHWLTLPISGAHLLAGKIAGIVLLVWLVPLAVLWPWWLAHHWGMTDLLLGTAGLVLVHALVVLPAALVAVLTDGWTRFVTWAFVFVVFVVTIVVLLLIQYESVPFEIRPPGEALPESQLIVGSVVMVGVIAMVLLNQYLTRRRARSLLMVSLGGGLAALTAQFWRTDLIQPVMDRWTHQPLPEKRLSLNLGPLSGATNQTNVVGVKAEGTLDLAPEDRVYGQVRDFGWRWSNNGVWRKSANSALSSVRFFASRASFDDKQSSDAIFERQNVISSLGLLPVPPYVARKLLAEPAEFRARLDLAIIHQEVLAETTPRPGARFGRGPERFRIVSLERRKGLAPRNGFSGRDDPTELGDFVMIETLPLIYSRLRDVWRFPGVTFQSFIFSNLVSRGEARSRVNRSNALTSRELGTFAGVLVSRYVGVIGPPRQYFPDRTIGERSAVLDPHWLDDLELYWTESRPIARTEMEVVEPHFVTQEELPNTSLPLRALRAKP